MDARISSSSGKETMAAVEYRNLLPPERRQRALKALGICWGISFVTIPLPPIHWVTVPGAFLLGFYFAWKRWRETKFSLGFRFSCPECGKAVDASAQASKKTWEVICPHCRYGLKVETGIQIEQNSSL